MEIVRVYAAHRRFTMNKHSTHQISHREQNYDQQEEGNDLTPLRLVPVVDGEILDPCTMLYVALPCQILVSPCKMTATLCNPVADVDMVIYQIPHHPNYGKS